jgi:hypothetical protein
MYLKIKGGVTTKMATPKITSIKLTVEFETGFKVELTDKKALDSLTPDALKVLSASARDEKKKRMESNFLELWSGRKNEDPMKSYVENSVKSKL